MTVDRISDTQSEASIVVYAGGRAQPRLAAADMGAACKDSLTDLVAGVRAAEQLSAERLFHISSGGACYGFGTASKKEEAYPTPSVPYGALKAMEELFVAQICGATMEVCSLRCTNLYGSSQEDNRSQGIIPIAIRKAIRGERLELFANAANLRDYLLVDDLAHLLLALGPVKGLPQILNVGSGTQVTTAELLKTLSSTIELPLDVDYLGDAEPIEDGTVDLDLLHSILPWQPTSLADGVRMVYAEIAAELAS